MKLEKNKMFFKDEHEKSLYTDLVDHLTNHYCKKTNARRLVHNIEWFMNEGRGDWFAGYLFDITGWISCWGIYEGGQDKEKHDLYVQFMSSGYDELVKTHKAKTGDTLVSYAVMAAYNLIMRSCEKQGLVEIKA